MILSKVLTKYQVTLPKEVVRTLHISKGDVLRCEIKGGGVYFVPVAVDDLYSEEEFAKFDSLYNDPANRGTVYKNKSEAVEHLQRLKRAR